MKTITALPKWWGYFMILLAGLFSFPAVGHLMEGHQSELWELKSEVMGTYYPYGVLIWSYGALLVSAYFLGKGYEILRYSDPNNPE